MFKEPSLFVNRASVTVNYIYNRIKLKKNDKSFVLNHVNIPKNRGSPHSNLKNNVDNLSQISEKYYDCTGTITESEHQYKHAKRIVYKLNCIYVGIISVATGHNKENYRKKYMNECCSNYLNNRKYTNLKYYLLDQIAVLQKRIRTINNRFRKIEPRNQSRLRW